ncbi:MAG: permease [Elusimicrobia bacterium]|nr:permease [Elusimicrobiota bacterium]
MDFKKEWKTLIWLAAAFLVAYHLPVGTIRFDGAVMEGLHLVKSYAREHVILCLLPAFFIAGAISVFVSQGAVMRYLGSQAHPAVAYGMASISGTILAVCSCTVLPLFGGIYKRGAGLGPAVAFLYSGPAINVLAIVLTARVLGLEMGAARTVGAVAFSVTAGLIMQFLFRKEEAQRAEASAQTLPEIPARALWKTTVVFAAMVGILVLANWGAASGGLSSAVFSHKWPLTAGSALGLGAGLVAWFGLSKGKALAILVSTFGTWAVFPGSSTTVFAVGLGGLAWAAATSGGELEEWWAATWDFTKQVTPLLLIGVLAAGVLLGRPGHEGLVPSAWVAKMLGGNGAGANLFAAVAGALMYFATLTEIPILQGLMGSGMGKGPALTLLLAGPALSLPSMLVLRKLMGTRKTLAYVMVVVGLSAVTGWMYGMLF